jgi:hypothetical protein
MTLDSPPPPNLPNKHAATHDTRTEHSPKQHRKCLYIPPTSSTWRGKAEWQHFGGHRPQCDVVKHTGILQRLRSLHEITSSYVHGSQTGHLLRVIATPSLLNELPDEIWGYQSGVVKDSNLLGCDAVLLIESSPTFHRNRTRKHEGTTHPNDKVTN